jgi:hypothetical protein
MLVTRWLAILSLVLMLVGGRMWRAWVRCKEVTDQQFCCLSAGIALHQHAVASGRVSRCCRGTVDASPSYPHYGRLGGLLFLA